MRPQNHPNSDKMLHKCNSKEKFSFSLTLNTAVYTQNVGVTDSFQLGRDKCVKRDGEKSVIYFSLDRET